MQIGTVIRWDDAVFEAIDDGTGVVRAQVETLVPDAVLMRLFSEALWLFYGGGTVTVLNGFVVARVPNVQSEREIFLRELFDQYAASAEYEYRVEIGVACYER